VRFEVVTAVLEESGASVFMVKQLKKIRHLGILDPLLHFPLCPSVITAMCWSAFGHSAVNMT